MLPTLWSYYVEKDSILVNGLIIFKNDYQGLPPKEKFYASLYKSSISDSDYEHAENV